MPFFIPNNTPVVVLPLSHTNGAQITNVGINTHAQIDAAIVTANAHYANALIHVDHSLVSVTGGTSLAGGGVITGSSVITLINDVGAPGNSFFYGTSAAGVKGWLNHTTFVTGLISSTAPALHAATHASAGTDPVNHDTLLNYVADQHVAHSGVSITGGTSLAGGGNIAASRVLTLLNDVASPGNSFYYGTSGAGVKGFFALPVPVVPVLAQTEKDFGVTPVYGAVFSVVDAGVTAGMKVVASLAYDAPTGRDLDEVELVDFQISAGQVVAGAFSLLVQSLSGLVAGLYKFNYVRG